VAPVTPLERVERSVRVLLYMTAIGVVLAGLNMILVWQL
jgi:hypothetical protein